MRKKCLLMIAAGIVLATANVPTTAAQEVAGIEISPTSVLPITGVSESTDGNYNFKSFEVEASEAGSYYTEFWLLPSKYANNSYSSFMIYVNDNYIGSITPTVGNWQAVRVDGHETFDMTEGTNVITIATLAPEFPEVETLKVSLNDADATFSSEAYEEYLDDAAAGVTYDIPEDDGMTVYASDATGVGPAHFSNVPLNYTFYKTFSFTKGQEIFITSSSSAAHKIDVVYYGSEPKSSGLIGPTNPIITPINSGILNPGVINLTSLNPLAESSVIIRPYVKFRVLYTPATSEEMQGLSWVFPSQKTLNSSMQVATAKMRITKSGQYLVRVRHAVNGGSALADVNVNGAYYYENTPITLSYKSCVIPADGNYYATFTCCNNFGTDDPYLFIHGADVDKIVGFNDDAPSAQREQYNLSTWDSYISQKYFMKTSGISVSNYSSSKPTSRCNIVARISEGAAQSVAKARAKAANTAGVTEMSITDESVQIAVPANINDSFSINTTEIIHKVSIYGLAGNRIGSVNCNESCAIIPTSSLNINHPGIYVISVETSNGVISKKVAIK
ncbi:T9SS type A sorting domain-containing protein [Barnesiella sp. WM24]|uniref:T9SS type A sorting domain-containing protein n=1 Tax=Barnesiella sp. WM24 TaxID=2558278 RepID=UPI001071ABCF|nr:T9SS type A sorting domain-containing protein [Barnesiella sp. WM24]TFU91697.1 T9SS type A sorting domain-containing protein [Barnesiella sp. WM24]